MTDFDQAKHPRNDSSGQFTETARADAGANVLTIERTPRLTGLNDRSGLTDEQWRHAQNYNDRFAFDHPLQVLEDGSLAEPERARELWTDELGIVDCDIDGQIGPAEEARWVRDLNDAGWEPVTGYSGQYGYSGPIMHASEFLGGGMAESLAATPGTYVTIMVETWPDTEDAERDVVGWALLRRIDSEDQR